MVDDRDSELYALLLEKEGFTVYRASSTADALLWLKSNDTDAILSDLSLPRQDGLSFIESLDRKRYRIALMTGMYLTPVARQILMEGGAEMVFEKTVHGKQLVAQVVEWLKKERG